MGLALLAGACRDPTGSNRQIVSLTVSPDSAVEYLSDSLLATVVARDRQGNLAPLIGVAWSSRNEKVATVSRSGWITARQKGRTSIIASAGGLQDSLLIISRARGITTVAPAFDTLVFIGQRIQLQAQTADSAGPLPALYLWISRDPGVASVTQTGQITARGNGATWVVAIEASGSRDSARVVVRQAVVAVRVTPGVISRPVARQQRFSAAPLDSGGTAVPALTVAWSSARPALATVDSSGSATAVAAGVDTIRAEIAGVSGAAVLIIDPLPRLRFNLDTFELGVGQYASGFQLQLPQLIVDSLDPPEWFIADLTMADTSVAFAPDSLVDPVSHGVFTIGGRARGLTTLTATAGQYSPATAAIRVSSPRLLVGEGRLDTLAMNDAASLIVSTGDSLGHGHRLVDPVVIVAASSDPAVVRPGSDTLVALANDPGVNTSVLPVGAGTAWVRFGAAGYQPDSLRFVVVPQRLQFQQPNRAPLTRTSIGAGQESGTGWTILSTGLTPRIDTVWVSINHLHPEFLLIPPEDTLQMVSGAGWAHLEWSGLAPGTDTILATASGYLPDTLFVLVTSPAYRVNAVGPVRGDARPTISVLRADSLGNPHYRFIPDRAVVTSSDTTVLRTDRDTVQLATEGGDVVLVPAGPGTATLTFTDPTGVSLTSVSPPITVIPAPVVLGLGNEVKRATTLGMRQQMSRDSIPFITIPDHLGAPVPITFRSTNPAMVRASPGHVVIIGTGLRFEIVGGDTTGTAWIVAEGPTVTADSMLVEVGRPQFVVRGRGRGGDTVQAIAVEVRDQAGNKRVAAEDVVASISSSNFSLITPDSSTLTVPALGDSSGVSVLKYFTFGTVFIQASDRRIAYYHYDPGSSGLLPRAP